jgi:hypothetical protein
MATSKPRDPGTRYFDDPDLETIRVAVASSTFRRRDAASVVEELHRLGVLRPDIGPEVARCGATRYREENPA